MKYNPNTEFSFDTGRRVIFCDSSSYCFLISKVEDYVDTKTASLFSFTVIEKCNRSLKQPYKNAEMRQQKTSSVGLE